MRHSTCTATFSYSCLGVEEGGREGHKQESWPPPSPARMKANSAERLLAQSIGRTRTAGSSFLVNLQAWPQPLAAARTVEAELARASESTRLRSAVLHVGGTTGSDATQLRNATPVDRATHFQDVANLVRTVGEAKLPVVAMLDGCATGGALGLGAHATACVVTERTRVALPGPLHGFVPESFASFQLARLPVPGLGAYVALTGAALSGQELVEVGLATHSTESQASWRIERELTRQRSRHLGQLLRTIELGCIEPAWREYDEGDALYYAEGIAECFAEATVASILAKLDAGGTAWHAQAAYAVRLASPLAAAATLHGIRHAATLDCWAVALQAESRLCAAAAGAADCASGAASLERAKRAMLHTEASLAAFAKADADAGADDADADDEGAEGGGAEGGGSGATEAEAGEALSAATGSAAETAPAGTARGARWEHASVEEVAKAGALAGYMAAIEGRS